MLHQIREDEQSYQMLTDWQRLSYAGASWHGLGWHAPLDMSSCRWISCLPNDGADWRCIGARLKTLAMMWSDVIRGKPSRRSNRRAPPELSLHSRYDPQTQGEICDNPRYVEHREANVPWALRLIGAKDIAPKLLPDWRPEETLLTPHLSQTLS